MRLTELFSPESAATLRVTSQAFDVDGRTRFDLYKQISEYRLGVELLLDDNAASDRGRRSHKSLARPVTTPEQTLTGDLNTHPPHRPRRYWRA